jgi:hypothetical protein
MDFPEAAGGIAYRISSGAFSTVQLPPMGWIMARKAIRESLSFWAQVSL